MNTQPNHVLHQPSQGKPIPWYEHGERAREILDQFPDDQFYIVACDVNYEDELYCDHCNRRIEPAYGE